MINTIRLALTVQIIESGDFVQGPSVWSVVDMEQYLATTKDSCLQLVFVFHAINILNNDLSEEDVQSPMKTMVVIGSIPKYVASILKPPITLLTG